MTDLHTGQGLVSILREHAQYDCAGMIQAEINEALNDAANEIERLRNRIQDEIERNEKRVATLVRDAENYDVGSQDRARIRGKASAYDHVREDLSHILD